MRTQRSASRLLIGAAVVALAAFFGYEGYARLSQFVAGVPDELERTVRLTQPYGGFILPSPPDEIHAAAAAARNAGTGGGGGVAANTTVVTAKESSQPPPIHKAAPEPARAESPQPVTRPAPAAVTAAPPQVATTETSPSPAPAPPPAQRACTQAIAALGLCTLAQPTAMQPRREAEQPRKVQNGQEKTRGQGCDAPTAALGLCRS